MVNPGDYVASDEEIDVEMFDSDTDLMTATASATVTTTANGRQLSPTPSKSDSDSDFMSANKPKRGSAATKRGGRGRGRGASTGTSRSAKTPALETNDAEAPSAAKTRRGRPRKIVIDADDDDDDQSGFERLKPTRGRKKTATVSADLSDAAEDEFDLIDDDSEFGKPKPKAKARKTPAAAKGKARQITLDEIKLPQKELVFDPVLVAELASRYPDPYWAELASVANKPSDMDTDESSKELSRIDLIDENHPLELVATNINDQMALTGMALSPDGTMLATFGSSGSVHIWDTDTFECLTTLRDFDEANIDEFFVGQFTPNSEYLVVGGKLKDRKRWSEADEDNHILPCPLKIFNILTGQVVARLEGHSEEILSAKAVTYKGENYFVTTSQDGYIRRWHMDSDWVVLLDSREVEDGVTCMAFTVSFVPNTGNRFFIAATDDHVTLMDMETCKIVQRFDPIYSSYCDCGKFIDILEEPVYQVRKPVSIEDDGSNGDSSAAPTATASTLTNETAPEVNGPFAYFVTRGVELLDAEDNTVSSRPNTCTLHRLVYPTEPDGKFELQEIRRYHHDEYLSNSWLIRIASNGRYILAPTLNGQVFVFSIATGQVTGILRDHDIIEVRDCKFHPTKNLLFTCSDDGTVKVYRSTKRVESETPVAEDVDMKGVEAVAAAAAADAGEDGGEVDSPETMAVSPVASLKQKVESLAVHDNDTEVSVSVGADSGGVPGAEGGANN
ncbi:hypothetical protein GGI07_002063 [Coemansia sp. Benny D115]|nr:hypothetical protein GGI07_002063 [Coemansia sp. Benny D115]